MELTTFQEAVDWPGFQILSGLLFVVVMDQLDGKGPAGAGGDLISSPMEVRR